MDILFVATELAPMVKVGGLADVVAALSKALRLLGHNVTIALPRFPAIEAAGVMVARRLTPLTIPIGDERVEVTVFDGRLGSGVGLLLLDAPGLFDRPGVYGDATGDYPDNARRFGVFARAVVEIVRQRALTGSPFDIVHLHDWPAAPVGYLLRERRAELSRTRTVLTIHNLAHQGVFPPTEILDVLGLDQQHFTPERLEFYGSVNLAKGGIIAADAVTTVSTTYAREILTPERGERLDGVLQTRSETLTGIVNGIDYAVWNPTTDPALVARYDGEDPTNKGRCRSALLHEIGMEIAPERPIVASIGRIVAQKGSDVLAAALPKILRSEVSVIIAGTGDQALMDKLASAAEKAPGRAAFLGAVAEPVVHRILAAADIVLVPSRFEPCGLVQLYAQRYGALPVATRTGGLVDTVVDIDAELETGTGVLIDGPTPQSLLGGVQRAVAATAHPRWGTLRRRLMRLDLGWDRPARRYAHVYRSLLS